MRRILAALFAGTVFLAAFLLFLIQPMVARSVLPTFGGSPSVWTTCVLFFQTALLAGYAYAAVLRGWLSVRRQAVGHVMILATGLWFLPPVVAPASSAGTDLGWTLFVLLVRSVGLPVFLVATTSPLIQGWYSETGLPASRDPYHLYAASNLGSFLALVAYPFWVERHLGLSRQAGLWAAGYGGSLVAVAACATAAVLRSKSEPGAPGVDGKAPPACPVWLWVVLAMVPSSLMLGVTSYLTTDLAAIPLLWVVPLGLYLLSFVATFASRPWVPLAVSARVFPWLAVALAIVLGFGLVRPVWMVLHLSTFFAAALVCHGELAARRPDTARLTAFYLAVAGGGAAGGLFNALVAPRVFDRVAEYPIALVGACLVLTLRPNEPVTRKRRSARPDRIRTEAGEATRASRAAREMWLPIVVGLAAAPVCADTGGVSASAVGAVAITAASGLTALAVATHRARPLRFALTLGALLAASGLSAGVGGRVLVRERSFFGVLKVTETRDGRARRLFHGSTLHGQQSLEPGRRREPLTYFTETGPVGDVFRVLRDGAPDRPARVAVTGVGVGSLASYAKEGDAWTFYEIDPAVVRVARDPRFFTYLSDSEASSLDVQVGDGRLTLATARDHGFDLIVLDAFSSDAIPVHLMTREAVRLYWSKLADGGLLAFNVTNRYLDLGPVVAALADDLGLACRVRADVRVDKADEGAGKQGSIWAVMAGSDRDLGAIARDPKWVVPRPAPGDRVWTDDESDLLRHFRPFGRDFNRP